MLDTVLARLGRTSRQGEWFQARCPAHDDKTPSLRVKMGQRAVILHCHAGCDVNAIRQALKLEWADLFLEGFARPQETPSFNRRGAELEALVAASRLQAEREVLERLRSERGWPAPALGLLRVGWDGERLTIPCYDKEGRYHDTLRYHPFGGRPKMLSGFRRPRGPWPAPEQLTPPRGSPLFIVEGEGTAISLYSLGLLGVALPGTVSRPSGDPLRPGRFTGSGWHPSWKSRFQGFRRIVLLPDCDEIGRFTMNVVHHDLRREGLKAEVMDLAPHRDDGYDLGDLTKWAVNMELRQGAKRYLLAVVDNYLRGDA